MTITSRAIDFVRRSWHGLRRADPRVLWRRRRYHDANRQLEEDEIELRPGLRLRIDPAAREGFEYFCFRSLDMARELDGFIARRNDLQNLVDVGALHGVFSLAFTQGRPRARALALEPSPLAYPVLRSNLLRNPDAGVEALQVAAGAAPGTVAMRLTWHHLEACPPPASPSADFLTIPVQSLDTLCAERGFDADVLKIDVEGYELEVLRGAGALLSAGVEIFLELHPTALRALAGSASEVFDLLAARRYLIFDTEARPVSRRDFVTRRRVARYHCRR